MIDYITTWQQGFEVLGFFFLAGYGWVTGTAFAGWVWGRVAKKA
jgi:hypothetical protein